MTYMWCNYTILAQEHCLDSDHNTFSISNTRSALGLHKKIRGRQS